MEKPLLEEDLAQDRRYTKWVIKGVVVAWIAASIFLAASIFGLSTVWEDPDPWIIFGIFMFPLFAAWTAFSGIAYLCSRRQYLRIYPDRIVYRKPFQKHEGVLMLSPDQYTIRLYRARAWIYPTKYAVELVFLDTPKNTASCGEYKSLLSYKTVTFYAYAPRYPSSPQKQWEEALRGLGCKIIDYEKILTKQ